jgi:hypothetical protein
MNSNINTIPSGNASHLSCRPAMPHVSSQHRSAFWRTIAMAVLLTIALCLVVRVVLAVNQFDSALDTLNDGMKYLKADGRVTNF